ncbi:hypothetical protein ACF1E9_31730 [Streptomyces roseolus]|uniref:hypothetical protein n=1 Tax=Streptomyces roseolus TaxID=67358 RepID=UPI0036F74E91
MDMRTLVDELVGEAERLIRDQVWVLNPTDRTVAAKAATALDAAVGPSQIQETLPPMERLEHLREALAAVAIALARVHGHTAWFLGAAATALTPVLHWRALESEDRSAFGTVTPTLQQYTEAEEAVRRLQKTLAGIASG